MELERRRNLEVEKQARMQEEERRRQKELHFMHCPKCGMKLVEIDYKGITIDECSSCQGVWLDAGELSSVAKLEKGALDKLFGIFTKAD
jgi:Zn finger protein HypA/HybF involved in hydrogenase expression